MSIGQDLPHDSSRGHVTGESIFIDDRLEVAGEVFVGVVGSPIASGELLSIDSKAALAHPACLGVYTARDFVGKHWGSIVHDQPFLVETKINYMQEAVCLVVSSGRETLEEIKSLVRLETKSAVGVFSITDAKKAQTIIARAQKPFVQGNADLALKKAPHRLRGCFCMWRPRAFLPRISGCNCVSPRERAARSAFIESAPERNPKGSGRSLRLATPSCGVCGEADGGRIWR